LRVVAIGQDLLSVDIDVVTAVEIKLQSHAGRQVELRVQRAGTMARLDGGRSAELVDVAGAGRGSSQATLDAIAFILDGRKGKVDLSDDASDIEALGISDAASFHCLQLRADGL